MNAGVSLAFTERSKYQANHARGKINHCLDQLQDESKVSTRRCWTQSTTRCATLRTIRAKFFTSPG